MPGSQTFKASIIAKGNAGTLFVFDYSYVDTNTSPAHLDTGIAAGNFQTLVQAKYLAILPDLVAIYKYRFATITGPYAGEIGYVDTGASGQQGLLSPTGMLPGEIAISMKRSTGHSTRGDRGRVFFGPVATDFQDTTNPDKVLSGGDLLAVCDLGKANLVTTGATLTPCLLNSAGAWNGHAINHTEMGDVFVHRRTRRFRSGV